MCEPSQFGKRGYCTVSCVVNVRLQFRYATKMDVFYMLLATVAAIANGTTLPLLELVFANVVNTFTNRAQEVCSYNFTALSLHYCPAGVVLTPSNLFTTAS